MERAERALLATRYFEAERLCRRALDRARRRRDFGRMARILMPLQEARRHKRQLAADADWRALVSRRTGGSIRAGFLLVQPPLVGIDARDLRERADESGTPVFVLCREPMTKAGLWPIVAAGPTPGRALPLVIRTRVPPPRSRGTTRSAARAVTPPAAWFEAAGEALGDAAIASVPGSLHPAWRVDELAALLDAFPDHEKLHQRLEEACREALIAPLPGRRPRTFGDPSCF